MDKLTPEKIEELRGLMKLGAFGPENLPALSIPEGQEYHREVFHSLPALLDAAERVADRYAESSAENHALASRAREDALREAAKIADTWATSEQRLHGNGGPASAILALIDKPKGGDANANGARNADKPIPATSPGITAGASAVEDDLCGRLRVYALAEDIMSSERRDLETAATRIRSLSAQLAEARREIEAFDVQEMGYAREIEHLAARAIAAESEAAALREALKPFAHAAEYLESETEGFTDDDPLTLTYRNEEACATDIGTVLQFGHFRRARSALEGRE